MVWSANMLQRTTRPIFINNVDQYRSKVIFNLIFLFNLIVLILIFLILILFSLIFKKIPSLNFHLILTKSEKTEMYRIDVHLYGPRNQARLMVRELPC